MKNLKGIKINGNETRIFDYIWSIYREFSGDYFLDLEFIVSENTALQYEYKRTLDITLMFDDNSEQQFEMHVDEVTEVGNGEVPVIRVVTKLESLKGFEHLPIFTEDTPIEDYPKLKDIDIKEIRKVEMPIREVDISVNLPIDLQEWIYKNESSMSEVLKEALYDYIQKMSSS